MPGRWSSLLVTGALATLPAGCAPRIAPSAATDGGSTAAPDARSEAGPGTATDAASEERSDAAPEAWPDARPDAAPPSSQRLLLIGQSGRRAHAEYVAATGSVPDGSSVYAELYSGRLLNWEHEALVAYLARDYPGSAVEVGLSWKDGRVAAGYCDLSAGCVRGCCDPADDAAPVAPELDIVAGRWDAALDVFAAFLRSYPGLRFLVRVDYEVSPDLHCTRGGDCAPYTAAFAHVARRLRGAGGVTNAELVFHPTRGWAQAMYPDPADVDWIGLSVFNHDVCLPATDGATTTVNCPAAQSIDEHLAADLRWAVASTDKPILIAESSVQNQVDDTPAAFEDYLRRLFAIPAANPRVAGLTYIDMKWTGGWVYGEDWTAGPFSDSDSRVQRDADVQAAWCRHLAEGRFGSGGGAATCRGAGAVRLPLPLPPDLDAPVYFLVVLASNACVRIPGAAIDDAGALVQGACSGDGRTRFRIVPAGGGAVRLFNDATWLCLDAGPAGEGAPLLQRPCTDAPSQRFQQSAAGGEPTDVRLVALATGRCVGVAGGATAAGAAMSLQSCTQAPAPVLRLLRQPR